MTWFLSLFTKEHKLRHAFVIIFVSSSFWGVLWMPMRYIEAMGVSALWVVSLFHFLPAIVLLPLVLIGSGTSKRDWIRAAIAGSLLGAGFVFYALGLIVASVTKTVILFYMTPIWSTVFAFFILNERAGWGRWVAIVGALFGCVLVMNVNGKEIYFEPADLLGLLSGLFWALGSVAVRYYRSTNFIHVTFLQYLFGGFLAVVAAVYLGDPVPGFYVLFEAVPPALLASVIIFMPTSLLVFRIMQYVSPGLVGILMLSEALIAALSASIWLGETLATTQWLGVITVLATGVLIGLHEGKSEKPSD